MSLLSRIGLLPRVLLAIVLGVLVGLVAPHRFVVVVATFNGIFSAFLSFIVPVLILALVALGVLALVVLIRLALTARRALVVTTELQEARRELQDLEF